MPEPSLSSTGQSVRALVYDKFISSQRPLTPWEIAQELGTQTMVAEEALRELAAAKCLVLREGTCAIRMAMPFSTDPTPFRVTAGNRTWFANCAWDALGISSVVQEPTRVHSACAQTGEEMVLDVSDSKLDGPQPVVHFAIPASQWWDDIVFT